MTAKTIAPGQLSQNVAGIRNKCPAVFVLIRGAEILGTRRTARSVPLAPFLKKRGAVASQPEPNATVLRPQRSCSEGSMRWLVANSAAACGGFVLAQCSSINLGCHH